MSSSTETKKRNTKLWVAAAVVVVAAGAAAAAAALLVNVLEHKQEAKTPFFRVVELTDDTQDPAVWGQNFPLQYDDYKKTVDMERTRLGEARRFPKKKPTGTHAIKCLNPKSKKTPG